MEGVLGGEYAGRERKEREMRVRETSTSREERKGKLGLPSGRHQTVEAKQSVSTEALAPHRVKSSACGAIYFRNRPPPVRPLGSCPSRMSVGA